MHILQINKFYHIEGGADRYFMELSSLLAKKGHQVAVFSTNDTRNLHTLWKKYFPEQINFSQFNFRNITKFIYNREARRKMSDLLDNFPCEIAHLHNIYHHLTPSIIPELKKRKIPIVMTVGDYHLISPNYFMFHNGKVCEITNKDHYYKAIFHRCVKKSYLKSILEVTEKYIYKILDWEKNYIDVFIAPSSFMKNKLLEYGIPENKVTTLPYFIESNKYKPNYNPGKYILYFGRLSEEKGLKILLQAMQKLPDIKLVIAGTGPEKEELRIRNYKLGNRNVKFVGFKEGKGLIRFIQGCRFTILPSVWNEVFGISILESFACGKPVIASNIGGVPEIINDGENGLLVEPNDVNGLANAIDELWNDQFKIRKLGKSGRENAVKKYGKEKHYEKIMALYKKFV